MDFFTFLLSVASLALVYVAIDKCRESAFVPIYYFIALAISSAGMLAASKISDRLLSDSILATPILQDLFLAYTVLFLFGSLWQSYEAEICIPDFVD